MSRPPETPFCVRDGVVFNADWLTVDINCKTGDIGTTGRVNQKKDFNILYGPANGQRSGRFDILGQLNSLQFDDRYPNNPPRAKLSAPSKQYSDRPTAADFVTGIKFVLDLDIELQRRYRELGWYKGVGPSQVGKIKSTVRTNEQGEDVMVPPEDRYQPATVHDEKWDRTECVVRFSAKKCTEEEWSKFTKSAREMKPLGMQETLEMAYPSYGVWLGGGSSEVEQRAVKSQFAKTFHRVGAPTQVVEIGENKPQWIPPCVGRFVLWPRIYYDPEKGVYLHWFVQDMELDAPPSRAHWLPVALRSRFEKTPETVNEPDAFSPPWFRHYLTCRAKEREEYLAKRERESEDVEHGEKKPRLETTVIQ